METPPVTVKDTLTALDLPWSDELAQRLEGIGHRDLPRQLGRLLTAAIARDCWLQWNPNQRARIADQNFLRHFRDFLAQGLRLGYRLSRFRDISGGLPDPAGAAKNWIPFFEQAVTGDDCATMRLFLSHEQLAAFRSGQQSEKEMSWDQMMSMMADGLFYELGIVLRPVTVLADDDLTSPLFRCEWNDLRLPPERGLDVDTVLVDDTVDRLALLNIKGREAVNPANRAESARISRADKATAETAGLTTWDARGYVVLALAAAIRRAAEALVNRSLYDLYMANLRRFHHDLVTTVEEVMDRDFLVQVLRGLLEEEITVRDMQTVLGAALELRATIAVDLNTLIVFFPATGGVYPDPQRRSPSDLLPADYTEFIRARLKRYISHKYSRGSNTLVVYLIDRGTESTVSGAIDVDSATVVSIKKAVKEELSSLPPTAQVPVILTSMEARRKLRCMLVGDFPQLAVLSYQELSPDMNIQPIARITPV